MSLEQLEWLKGHIKQLEALGMVKRVHNPVWGVPVFVVAKPHGKGWRMVADFRSVNSRMVPTSLPLPLLEQMLGATTGAKIFGSLDNMKGFDGLAATDTEPFTLVTPFGCYQMMVAPMGYLNSAAVYQDRIVHEVLKDIHGKTCVNWIDDNLVWGEDETEYLDRLDEILGRYETHNVKLNFPKCQLYKRKLVWGGRELSEDGYCYDPNFYDKVLETPEPELAIELHDFLFALGWIQDSLEPFGILEAKSILADFLSELFKSKTPNGKAPSRKKKTLVGMKLKDFGWGTKQQKAFKKCLEIVHKAIRVAVPDKTKELCLFTDASTVGCSILVTQAEAQELSKPIREQKHEIIFMTTHRWDETEARWHISSQEAFPIVFALNRLDYLFAGRKINIFMDHKNLAYIFNPDKETPKTTLNRLQRWALIIQSRQYCIRHIAGEDNVAADLFSRWALSQRREKNTVAKSARWLRRLEDFNARGRKNQKVEPHERRRKKVGFIEEVEVIPKDEDAKVNPPIEAEEQVLEPSVFQDVCSRTDPLRSNHGEALKVPSMQDIKEAQKQSADTRPKKCKLNQNGIWLVNDRIWVPTELALYL